MLVHRILALMEDRVPPLSLAMHAPVPRTFLGRPVSPCLMLVHRIPARMAPTVLSHHLGSYVHVLLIILVHLVRH